MEAKAQASSSSDAKDESGEAFENKKTFEYFKSLATEKIREGRRFDTLEDVHDAMDAYRMVHDPHRKQVVKRAQPDRVYYGCASDGCAFRAHFCYPLLQKTSKQEYRKRRRDRESTNGVPPPSAGKPTTSVANLVSAANAANAVNAALASASGAPATAVPALAASLAASSSSGSGSVGGLGSSGANNATAKVALARVLASAATAAASATAAVAVAANSALVKPSPAVSSSLTGAIPLTGVANPSSSSTSTPASSSSSSSSSMPLSSTKASSGSVVGPGASPSVTPLDRNSVIAKAIAATLAPPLSSITLAPSPLPVPGLPPLAAASALPSSSSSSSSTPGAPSSTTSTATGNAPASLQPSSSSSSSLSSSTPSSTPSSSSSSSLSSSSSTTGASSLVPLLNMEPANNASSPSSSSSSSSSSAAAAVLPLSASLLKYKKRKCESDDFHGWKCTKWVDHTCVEDTSQMAPISVTKLRPAVLALVKDRSDLNIKDLQKAISEILGSVWQPQYQAIYRCLAPDQQARVARPEGEADES